MPILQRDQVTLLAAIFDFYFFSYVIH